jgi:hypothetical protein
MPDVEAVEPIIPLYRMALRSGYDLSACVFQAQITGYMYIAV